MTDRISYFQLEVNGDAGRVAAACGLFACVRQAQVLPDGTVLGILDEPIRDESCDWGVIEDALRTLSGVTKVMKHVLRPVYYENHGLALAKRVTELLDRAKPTTPDDDETLSEFVVRHRSWHRAVRILRPAISAVIARDLP